MPDVPWQLVIMDRNMCVRTQQVAAHDGGRPRPPAVYGHFVNVPTHFNVKCFWSAATCLTRTVIYWLSAPAIMDSANKCHVFGGHFNQKSLARTPTWDRHFVQISVLSSGDQRAICHVIETDEPRDCGKPTPSLVMFVSRHQRKSHVLCLFNPRCWRTEWFIVWTNE